MGSFSIADKVYKTGQRHYYVLKIVLEIHIVLKMSLGAITISITNASNI